MHHINTETLSLEGPTLHLLQPAQSKPSLAIPGLLVKTVQTYVQSVWQNHGDSIKTRKRKQQQTYIATETLKCDKATPQNGKLRPGGHQFCETLGSQIGLGC